MRALNKAMRFLLELASLAALAHWGWQTEGPLPLRMAAAIAGPALASLVWAVLVAPGSSRRLDDPARLLVELAVFGTATFGLIAAGNASLGIAFALAVGVNLALMSIWSQR